MGRWLARTGWITAGALALLVVASVVGGVSGGSIDPPGPVGSTMKSLDDVLPSWHRELDHTGGCDSPRYDCVFSNAAFLDRETGLVWERAHATVRTWAQAHDLCPIRNTGNTLGWRLPSVDELVSLVEPEGGITAPLLIPPADDTLWWSNTTSHTVAVAHFAVRPASGLPAQVWPNATTFNVLCVRGPGGG